MVLKSIVDLCDHTQPGNVAHKIATIKHQAIYAQEQLIRITESENQIKEQ